MKSLIPVLHRFLTAVEFLLIKIFPNLKLIDLAEENQIGFASFSSIFKGRGVPDNKTLNILKKVISVIKEYWQESYIQAELKSVFSLYSQISIDQWMSFTEKLINHLRLLEPETIVYVNEKTLRIMSKLTFLNYIEIIDDEKIKEIINKALSLLPHFLTDLKIKYNNLPEEERKNFLKNSNEVKKAVADLFSIDLTTLELILAFIKADTFTLTHQCLYGERSTPLMISLDEERNGDRPWYEKIGENEEAEYEEVDFFPL